MKPDIQKLKHGKLITKVTTPTFVETWNYITDKVENFKGDADVGEYGYINVDNDNPEAPVIRLKINKLKNDLGKNEDIFVDSQICALMLSSLEHNVYELSTEIKDSTGKVISVDVSYVSAYEIFDFHDRDNTVQYPVLSDYNMICRWKDPESEKMIVKYLPLSGEMCDTEVSALNQKSVEHRTEDGKQFIQLHDFEKQNAVKLDIDPDDGHVKYDGNDAEILFRNRTEDNTELMYGVLDLSGVSSIVSCIISNDISTFNSVSNYISSVVNNNISNLTNLSTYINNNISNFSNLSTYISNFIEYNLSDFESLSNYISSVVNNNISNFNNLSTYITNNISNWNEVSNYISNIVNNNISNFNNLSNYISSTVNNNISNFNNLSTYIDNNISNFNNTTNYISNVVSCIISSELSTVSVDCDTNVLTGVSDYQRSIESKTSSKKIKYHQLYKFDDRKQLHKHSQTIANYYYSPIGCGTGFEFLVRKHNGCSDYLDYAQLSVKVNLEDTDTEMSNHGRIAPQMRSINHTEGCSRNYLELYTFGCNNVVHGFKPSMVEDDYELHHCDSFVIRRYTGCGNHEIEYLGFDVISSFADYKGDSQLTATDHLYPQQKSIQRNYDELYGWYYQLYGWCGGSHNEYTINAHCDGCTYDWGDNTKVDDDGNDIKSDQWYFLCQHEKANGQRTLEYRRLMVQLPEIPDDIPSGDDITNIWNNFDNYWTINQCSAIISGLQDQINGLSDDYWQLGGSYEQCYGYSIGDSNKNFTIGIDTHYLNGDWWVGGSLYAQDGITVNNGDVLANNIKTWGSWGKFQTGCSYLDGCCLYVDGCACVMNGLTVQAGGIAVVGCSTFTDSIGVTYGISVGCGSAGITIGQTTLTEDKLNKLLSLIEGCSTAVDKVNAL